MVSPLLLLIHRRPIEMSKAGSGEGGGRTTALHPQISSTHSPGQKALLVAELEKGNSVVTGRVVARVVSQRLLFIHRGPMEMVNAGSGGVGGRTAALHP